MQTIISICARGGSVGVPGKNIKMLAGKPLIVHTIEQAQAVPNIDRIVVSTDCEKIAAVALEAGAEVPFLRPAELATSQASKIDVLQHLVNWVEQDTGPVTTLVDLDPTSPLRLISDITDCIALLDDETDLVITGYEADKNPYFNMVEPKPDGNIGLVKSLPSGVVARQAAPPVYSMNASIYIWRRDAVFNGLWGGRTKLHVMPRERSIDVDEPIDFDLVEFFMTRKGQ